MAKPACASRIVLGYVLRHVAERLLPLAGGDGRQAVDPKLQRQMQGQLLPQVEGSELLPRASNSACYGSGMQAYPALAAFRP